MGVNKTTLFDRGTAFVSLSWERLHIVIQPQTLTCAQDHTQIHTLLKKKKKYAENKHVLHDVSAHLLQQKRDDTTNKIEVSFHLANAPYLASLLTFARTTKYTPAAIKTTRKTAPNRGTRIVMSLFFRPAFCWEKKAKWKIKICEAQEIRLSTKILRNTMGWVCTACVHVHVFVAAKCVLMFQRA